MPITMDEAMFRRGYAYGEFLDRHATADQRARWLATREAVNLAPSQRELLAAFTRDLNVICLAGAWCGDCARQCPLLDCIASGSSRIHLRFFDRDAEPDLARDLRICGGARVPVVVFLSEDFAECGRYGDRTLSHYRRMAALAGAPVASLAGTNMDGDLERQQLVMAEWLAEFERVQWMLRVSPRLRAKHGD